MKSVRQIFSLAAVIAMAFVSSGCKTDDPSDKVTSCTQDLDCDPGFYCDDDDKCVQDCDPGAAEPGCAAGTSCDSFGRCVSSGECVVDEDCDSGPADATCDGSDIVGGSQVGTCDSGENGTVCNYAETRTTCENGCLGGECLPDACENVVCNAAPSPVCDGDGTTLITYSAAGTCLDGVCDYQETRMACAAGCNNARCLEGGCDGVTCDDPPADDCDGEVARRYGQAGTCVDNNGTPFCDYDLEFEDCLYTFATCNNATCEGGVTEVGPLVIVEYMANPAGSFNDIGEWFEVVNTSNAAVELDGWTIRSAGTGNTPEEHVIAGLGPIDAGARMVFAYSDSVPFTPDYNYADVRLANNTDWIQLIDPNGGVSDHVYYEGGSILAGRSRKLSPAAPLDAASNNLFSNWCPSMGDEFATSPSNYGTPGGANTDCVADPCAGFTCEAPLGYCLDAENKAVQFVSNNTMCEVTRLNNPYCDYDTVEVQCTEGSQICAFGVCETIPPNVPQPGEVIFTEFMGNPDGSDTSREWFEIYNTTGGELSLFSVIFADSDSGNANDSFMFLDVNATVGAGQYLVFARDVDPSANGGVSGAFLYSGGHLKNNPDETQPFTLKLTQHDGTLIDESFYDNPVTITSSLPSGRALQLDPGSLTAAGNDDGANFCFATVSYGDGGEGSPGAANEVCP